MILGCPSSAGGYFVVASSRLKQAHMEAVYHEAAEEELFGGGVTMRGAGMLASVKFSAETAPADDDESVYLVVTGDSYVEAIRRLGTIGGMKELQDNVTHAKVADVVADVLEVSTDDDIVQRIAAAIMEAGTHA